MAFLQTDLDRIDTAIAQGASSVTLESGERIERRSVRELIRARNYIASRMTKRRPRAYGVYSNKGV